jgi:hypothetical protein
VGDAHSRFEGIEWMGTEKVARIRTTYTVSVPTGEQVDIKQIGKSASAGGSGSSGGMHMAAMSGPSGSGGAANKVEFAKIRGDRTTWFDYAQGRVVAVHDVRNIDNLPKAFSQDAGGAGGGTGGGPSGGMGGGMMSGGGMLAGGGMGSSGMGGQTGPDVDMSWLTGFENTNDYATLQALTQAQSAAGSMTGAMGSGYPGVGAPGAGYPGAAGMPASFSNLLNPLGSALGLPMGSGAPGSGGQTEAPPPTYQEVLDINLLGATDTIPGGTQTVAAAPVRPDSIPLRDRMKVASRVDGDYPKGAR